MTNFDKLIKDLHTEIEALKTIRRKSSLTLTTTTKTATGTAVAHYTGHVSTLTRAALIKLTPTDPENPFIFSWTLQPYAQRGRNIEIVPWTTSDGNPALVLAPSLNTGESGNIPVSVNITATGDFTISTAQIIYDGDY